MRRFVAIFIGKIVVYLSRLRGGGSSLPGLIAEKIYPSLVSSFRQHLRLVVLVTGTNGKTTTTKMLREILRSKFSNIVHNEAGSNMSRGVVSAVISSMSWSGKLEADVGLFEVDEGFIARLSRELEPDALVVLNLHRDQLDRYGELERIKQFIEDAASHAKSTVLNVDDSRLEELSNKITPLIKVAATREVRKLVPSDDELGQRGESLYHKDHEDADVYIDKVAGTKNGIQHAEITINGEVQKVSLQIPGVFNVYNAAMALGTSEILEVDTSSALTALATVKPAFGRTERVVVGDKTLQILLVKNPSGFNQVIMNFLNLDNRPVLIAVNDNYADGRDVSWLWDVDIENWSVADTRIITTGTRGYDMALRLQYADIESYTEQDLSLAVEDFIDMIPEGGEGYIVPTYTAMLAIRKILRNKASLKDWE